jgi:metal-sulfur cluster biosynthetic enzyme
VSAAEGRAGEVRQRINEIVDPCSSAMATPIGIDDLGILEEVVVDGDDVRVVLLPTSPHCLYVGLFEEQIEARVGALPWVRSVDVSLTRSMEIWDEGRLSELARRRLGRRRERRGAQRAHSAP